jgi:hypothetical protein
MMDKRETYPAIYIIFTLLNAIRRGIERTSGVNSRDKGLH